MHDLNLVAFSERTVPVPLAGKDFAVQFHRNTSLIEPEMADQLRNGQARGENLCLAIDDHVHAKTILISGYLYNLGPIW